MRLFYDRDGNIVGSFTGATPEIEAGLTMPGTEALAAPEDMAQRFNDPMDEAHPLSYQVIDGEIVPISGTDQS